MAVRLRVDVHSPIPIRWQLSEQLKHAIEGGGVPREQALPSIRELAGFLGINPNTVARAIEDLKQSGYVEARRGKGVFVASAPPTRRSPTLRQDFLKEAVIRGAALGMTPGDVAAGVLSVADVGLTALGGTAEVLVVECSAPELDFFARELQAHLPVRAAKCSSGTWRRPSDGSDRGVNGSLRSRPLRISRRWSGVWTVWGSRCSRSLRRCTSRPSSAWRSFHREHGSASSRRPSRRATRSSTRSPRPRYRTSRGSGPVRPPGARSVGSCGVWTLSSVRRRPPGGSRVSWVLRCRSSSTTGHSTSEPSNARGDRGAARRETPDPRCPAARPPRSGSCSPRVEFARAPRRSTAAPSCGSAMTGNEGGECVAAWRKQGWAPMPGERAPDRPAAEACAAPDADTLVSSAAREWRR